MTLFPIDPAAQAIIKSLETEPERWEDTYDYLTSGDELRLYKWKDGCLVSFSKPQLTINRRSKRALWNAYERWESERKDTTEKRARAELMAALERAHD